VASRERPPRHFVRFGDVAGCPTFGERGFAARVADDVGRFSFGSFRESENAPLAARGLPKLGLRMPSS
jgi:hypothetical protein